ncbi:ABC transporter substrate-binding protein [Nesterenkonia xinjiangensis]|uniref:Multiple sugar transport system substrate-binding protein n=1 Tax=Nesterenkonia xinjiangensis TaxID=225327 RepID=A0A7Z0K7Z6_9MICC|nr:ABC transporter substrate-binding protein [Nesterenkonia xinjiangensis]NYJ77106.1 multiple sugar transport system substrate-binding protein [Nesterenkonia xinjiangensis]
MSSTLTTPRHVPPSARRRRWMKAGAGLAIVGLAATACGNGGDDEGDVTLTFSWWGGDVRHQYTQEIIEIFEEEHPHITIDHRYGEWDGYWDQLATQTAAGDTPDIIQMDLVYLREYIESGILLPLEDIDTSEFTDELMDTGTLDGELYAMPVGQTALTFAVNPELIEEAGLEMPDDSTWTWDDLKDLAVGVSENTDAYGQSGSFDSAGLETWLRQTHGVSMVDDEGQLAWEPEDAVGYFEMLGEFDEAGAFPDAAEMAEQRGIAREQTLLATGEGAMFPAWDAMLVALSGNEEIDLEPLMMPSLTGDASDAYMYYKASMFYSVASGSDHPEEAQLFVDFLVNDERAGELQQIERGIPGNASIRDQIRDDLDGVESRIVEFSESLEDVVADSPPLAPEGYGAVQDIVIRYEDEFFFGRVTAEEAAERMHGEIEDAIS